jgi:hypothetical protein
MLSIYIYANQKNVRDTNLENGTDRLVCTPWHLPLHLRPIAVDHTVLHGRMSKNRQMHTLTLPATQLTVQKGWPCTTTRFAKRPGLASLNTRDKVRTQALKKVPEASLPFSSKMSVHQTVLVQAMLAVLAASGRLALIGQENLMAVWRGPWSSSQSTCSTALHTYVTALLLLAAQ